MEASSVLSIQELIKKPLTSLPSRYISHHQESQTLSAADDEEIPTINLECLIHGGEEASQIELQKLHSACRDWGFFQLVEHGISKEMLGNLNEEIQEFFKLPLEEKLKLKIREGEVEGYGTVILREDQTLDWGDRLYMITNPLHKRKPHLFPHIPQSLRSILESYIVECENVAIRIVELIGKALKIESDELEKAFEDGAQAMRMTYYPPCPEPDQVLGLAPHSDASGITIVNEVNGVKGLQIKRNGIWIPVKVTSGALVVNVGDILEVVSNGAYKSVEHRVTVNSEKERMSLAMFFLPKFECEIGPALSLTNPHNPPLFKRVAMDKYFKYVFPRKFDGKSRLEYMKITTTT
ncbi:hypothetical protein PIB30_002338 [Stylosanthes scabra]|uniref:Fe2OG dioxygenase domain-containing protein n=1 Tax=Stylosanthes scabra TaxID=79078 RepID=A0ABU6U206_9FABA|nr:hypothetical protein [Stylosanthes scabra]